MSRPNIAAFMVIVVGFGASLAGCAAWQTARGSEQQQDQIRQEQQQPEPPAGEIKDARREARERTERPAVPRITSPPKSTLSFEERTVIGALGSYCWIDRCTRTLTAVPHEREALPVPSGGVLRFDYGGEEPPSKVWAEHSPLLGRGKVGKPGDPLPERLPARREGGRTEIPAALPAGEYLIDVFVRIPEGDAKYYFRVVVEPDAGTLPDSGGPGGH